VPAVLPGDSRDIPIEAVTKFNHIIENYGIQTQAVLTISGREFTATKINRQSYRIGTSIISIGGVPITIHGVEVSAASSAIVLASTSSARKDHAAESDKPKISPSSQASKEADASVSSADLVGPGVHVGMDLPEKPKRKTQVSKTTFRTGVQ